MTHPLEADNRRLKEALEEARDLLIYYSSDAEDNACLAKIDAALAAEPASGEAVRYVPNRDETEEWNKICAPPPPPAQGEEATEALKPFMTADKDPSRKRAASEGLSEMGRGPSPPTQGEDERVRELVRQIVWGELSITAALRQRADEAMQAEREACASIAEDTQRDIMTGRQRQGQASVAYEIAQAIRARITPKEG